jgi:hypothetical protein
MSLPGVALGREFCRRSSDNDDGTTPASTTVAPTIHGWELALATSLLVATPARSDRSGVPSRGASP